MKNEYQNKKLDVKDSEIKASVPATTEYNFPQHSITIVASSLEEAYAILQEKLKAKEVTE